MSICRLTQQLIIVGIAACSLGSTAWAQPRCKDLIPEMGSKNTSSSAVNSLTLDFQAYLKELFANQILLTADVKALIEFLKKKGNLEVTFSETFKNSIAGQIHYDPLVEYLSDKNLNVKAVKNFLQTLLKVETITREDRAEKNNETADPYKIVFLPVKAGKFKMGVTHEPGEPRSPKHDVELTHDIEVGATKVTQMQWVQLMEQNPSYLDKIPADDIITINGVRVAPDYPVLKMPWFHALEYANRLSKAHKLKPCYNLKVVADSLGQPDWSLKLNAISPYECEGYRLPTRAEQEFIRRDRGRAKKLHFFGSDDQKLLEHAWLYTNNSDYDPKPVASRKPFVIDNQNFYDLYDIMSEWTWDSYKAGYSYGLDPWVEHEETDDRKHVTDHNEPGNWIYSGGLKNGVGFIGFRLVRSLNGRIPMR